MGSVQKVVLVVPCFNEEKRFAREAWPALARDGNLCILFVNDGSKDGTLALLETVAATAPKSMSVLSLAKNSGKAEAVRQGLLRALDDGAAIVGYVDADLATPPADMLRLVDTMREVPSLDVVIGARISRLGAKIVRSTSRHYLGRIFASAASLVLGEAVYDTQCGAKCFRAKGAFRAALDQPFLSMWAFDVELLGRLLRGSRTVEAIPSEAFREVPLNAWRDVAGSKLRATSMVRAAADLIFIRRALDRRKRT